MANKKRQHFVPKFYFKFFSPDETKINLLYLKAGNILHNISIREQCAQDNFYGDKTVEDAFSDLETVLAEALKFCHTIKSTKELDQNKRLLLMAAVYFQKSRTLAARERANTLNETFMHYHVEVGLNRDKKLSASQKDEIRQGLKYFKPNPHFHHIAEIHTSLTAAFGLSDLDLYILENQTTRPYIFSDAPAILFNQYYEKIRHTGVLGCQTPGLQVFYPISPTRCLMLLDGKKYKISGDSTGIISVNESDVAHLNKMQIHNAHQAVYFHDSAIADYIKGLWGTEKKRRKTNDMVVRVAHSAERKSSLMHSYAPLLAYSPKFSFLSYTPAGESAQPELIRSPKLVAEVQRLMAKQDRTTARTLLLIKILKPFTFVAACFSVALGRLKKLLQSKLRTNGNSSRKAI